jgi:hypothetical protein
VRNRFAGTCYRCGGHVAKGRGELERVTPEQYRMWPLTAKTRWLLVHGSCQIRFMNTDVHFQHNPAKTREAA